MVKTLTLLKTHSMFIRYIDV